MEKNKFGQDILDVLKRNGFNTEGIKKLYIHLKINEPPELEIEYFVN